MLLCNSYHMQIVKIVDLSHPVDAGTQVYPGDPEVRFEPHSTVARDGFNLLTVHMGSQSGTHVDAPYHFDDDTERIDEVPLGHFIGRGIIVDLQGIAPRSPITWNLISAQVAHAGAGDIVIFHTGFSRLWQSVEYFDNPFLTADACQHLLDQGVRTFGVDFLNIDETPDATHPGGDFDSHHLIAKAGGIICENLTNLESIDFDEPLISILPIKFTGADGAPVRAVALQAV